MFLDGIGQKKESNIWQNGVLDWGSFLNTVKIKGISRPRKLYYNRKILEAQKRLYNFDSSYFNGVLKDECVYLDIETDSIQGHGDITVFGLFDGVDSKIMIKDINLDYNSLKEELKKYKLIVTFNGSSFDIPFINKRYPGVIPDVAHFDLKSVTRRVGLDGGLKKIESELGINRRDLVDGMDGGDALRLWKMYKATGDMHYLNLLVEYNEEDVVNLKKIAEYCVGKMKENLLY
jgi:hypothetical protein